MPDEHKTVFISYRRNVASYIARAIFMDLRANDYDVFMDVESIDSGPFDRIILNQIGARAHFLVILAPGSVERFIEPDDWLRREIEYAMDKQRNIVPVLVNNFTFEGTEQYLTGKLADLPHYDALSVLHEYFEAAMAQLRTRYLKQPVYGKLQPTTKGTREVVRERIETVVNQMTPTKAELSAEEYLARGLVRATENGDFEGATEDLHEAFRLNPRYESLYEHFKADKSTKKHIFISYSHDDMTIMHRVKETFVDENFLTWTDEDLEPGTPIWTSAIGKAIESSHSLAVLMSPTARESPWVEQEVHYARIHKVPIFPLLVLGDERNSVPFVLIGAQWTDIRTKYVTQMARVIAAIDRNLNIKI